MSVENPQFQGLLPTAEFINRPINLQAKDGDPRKTAWAISLLKPHQREVKIWQEFQLMARTAIQGKGDQPALTVAQTEAQWGHSVAIDRPLPGAKEVFTRRKHFAPEHIVTVTGGVQALGQLAVEHGLLTPKDVSELETAAMVHDAGKELEFLCVKYALELNFNTHKITDLLSSPDIDIAARYKPEFDQVVAQFSKRISRITRNVGRRAQLAYDLASTVNELRLKSKGVSPKVIIIQKMVGHSSCPDTEALLKSLKRTKTGSVKQREIIATLIMHYVDDIVTNPNVINPGKDRNGEYALDSRCSQNEANKGYTQYNKAWKKDPRNQKGRETAFQMQRRVGHLVENKLAELLDVEDPLTLPTVINTRIRTNIHANWHRRQRHIKLDKASTTK